MLVVRSVVSGRVGICCSVSRCAAPQQRGSEHLDGGFGPPNRILLAVRLRLQRIIRSTGVRVWHLAWQGKLSSLGRATSRRSAARPAYIRIEEIHLPLMQSCSAPSVEVPRCGEVIDRERQVERGHRRRNRCLGRCRHRPDVARPRRWTVPMSCNAICERRLSLYAAACR